MPKEEFARRLYRTVGGKIAELRRSGGRELTQEQLASLTGGQLSRSAIANIERGRQRLALHHLYLITQALGVEPSELLPSPDSVYGAATQVPKDPKLRDWLAKIAKTTFNEEATNAKAKPD